MKAGGGLSSRQWQNSLIPQQDEISDTCAALFLSPVKEDSCCSINNILTAPASSAINPPRPALAVRDSLPISLLKLPVVPPTSSPTHTFISRDAPLPWKSPLFSHYLSLLAFQLLSPGRVRQAEVIIITIIIIITNIMRRGSCVCVQTAEPVQHCATGSGSVDDK